MTENEQIEARRAGEGFDRRAAGAGAGFGVAALLGGVVGMAGACPV